MNMRMRELSEASGLAKTTIHHYIREGLLPAASKSARNAALYGPEHVDRLRLISKLRAESGGELSIPQVRIVLAYLDRGVAAGPAARLAAAGIEPEAADAGLSDEGAQALERAGLIERAGEGGLSPGDVLVARACNALLQAGVEPEDLTPLADLLREVGMYASSLETALSVSVRELLDALLWRALET